MIVDMHCDTISRLWDERAKGRTETLRKNGLHVDLIRMQKSGYSVQNFALFVDREACRDPWEKVCQLYRLYLEELEPNKDLIEQVFCVADIAENERAGKMSALLTVEEGAVCRGEPEKLRELYHMGVRMLTLTWNYPNELGYPSLNLSKEEVNGVWQGLTEKGIVFLEEMEKLGVIADVSHLSDAGFYDVYEHTHKPFVASHSNARGVCGCARNLTDNMLRKLGERGGVAGLNFCKDFLRTAPSGQQNAGILEDVVRHAVYMTARGGVGVLGLGSDFDGIDTNEALPGAESMEILWHALKNGGYTERELDQIFRENVLRVYREVIG